MRLNLWAFTVALLPLLFAAWVMADPLNAIEQVKNLKRKHALAQAHRMVTKRVNAEYKAFRQEAIQQGAPAWLIDQIQNERKEALIDKLSEKLYWRLISQRDA